MKNFAVIKGHHWRVYINVYDYGVEVFFNARALPVSAHPSTAYSSGVPVYWGKDIYAWVDAVTKQTDTSPRDLYKQPLVRHWLRRLTDGRES